MARFMTPIWDPSGPTGPRWAPCWPHEPCYLDRDGPQIQGTPDTHRGVDNWKIYDIKQITICAEYHGVVQRPQLFCHVYMALGPWPQTGFRQTRLGLSSMARFSARILIFSCDQAALWTVFSVRLSVCLSVCHTFLTMFPSSYHHDIFRSYYQWQKWCPCKRSRS